MLVCITQILIYSTVCVSFSFIILEVISLAKTILAYRANDREVMSFDINMNVKVFSKEAGRRTDLWGVEVPLFLSYPTI